jgi:hypothetical protein
VIDAWGSLGGRGAAERAENVLKRMEQQYFACNHRINLTWDVYAAGVMKAWAKDSRKHAPPQAERLDARWKEPEKLDDPNFTPHPGIDTALVPPCSIPECSHHKSTTRSNPDEEWMYYLFYIHSCTHLLFAARLSANKMCMHHLLITPYPLTIKHI